MSADINSLGSLAQSARAKQLKTARGILLAIGILTVVVNGAMFAMIEQQVDAVINKEIAALRAKGMVENPAEVAKIRAQSIRVTQLLSGALIALGVLFIIFGLIVQRYPVPITVTSFVLYVGAAAVFGYWDPATLMAGLIFKVIVVAVLIKAIASAIAYQKAETAQQPLGALNPL